MLALLSKLVLSTWLLVSAFLLAQTAASTWNVLVVASLFAAVAFLTLALPGRPGFRWWGAALAAWLLVSTMLVPQASMGTVLHDVVMAMLMAVSTFFLPASWATHWKQEHSPAHR